MKEDRKCEQKVEKFARQLEILLTDSENCKEVKPEVVAAKWMGYSTEVHDGLVRLGDMATNAVLRGDVPPGRVKEIRQLCTQLFEAGPALKEAGRKNIALAERGNASAKAKLKAETRVKEASPTI